MSLEPCKSEKLTSSSGQLLGQFEVSFHWEQLQKHASSSLLKLGVATSNWHHFLYR